MRILPLGVLLLSLMASVFPASAANPAPDPDNAELKLPPGFQALVVADNLGPIRFMTISPAGDIYLRKKKDGLVVLHDADGDGRAESVQTFGDGGGTGVALHNGYVYYSSDDAVFRQALKPGELVPSGEKETIVKGLPNKGQHNAKSFAFDPEGNLFVEVGSPSNSFGTPDRALGAKGGDPTEFLKTHGGWWRFSADKLNQEQKDGTHFSTGHRHMLGIAWHPVSKSFFVMQMGRDQLSTVAPQFYDAEMSAEQPSEVMYRLKEGGNYGWPFAYYDWQQKSYMAAPEYGGDGKKKAEGADKYEPPLVAFPGHWAPLQTVIYTGTQFPEKYRNGAFVAFHGSWNRAPKPQRGYNVSFVPFDAKGLPLGSYEIFADGFSGLDEVQSPGQAKHRPCGLAMGPDGSLYVGDDAHGRVYRIIYTGAKP
ncbi:MAG: PQQ-dependent sugar dehydrogenase [Chthoniobacterales bacterium]